jgi:putative transposase
MGERYKFHSNEKLYFATTTVIHWIDVFTREPYRKIVMDSINYCIANKGLSVYAWVLMTNHIHMLVGTEEEPLSYIFRDWKKFTSKALTAAIAENERESREWMIKMFRSAGRKNPANQFVQFWQQGNHPLEINSEQFLINAIRYIHQNPVKAGFVNNAEDWKYSSIHAYMNKPSEIVTIPAMDLMFCS